MADRDPNRVVVFAKLPRPGHVKTRLAESIGECKACDLYLAWVPPYIRNLVADSTLSVEITLAIEPGWNRAEALREAREWIPVEVDWTLQQGEGLGERLTHAFDRQFERGFSRVFALGADSPHLKPQSLAPCFQLIQESDVALGPTEDGGYYTIGLRNPPGDLFRNIRWSTSETLQDTRTAAEKLGLTVAEGPNSYDLDTLEDLNRLIQEKAVENWRELDAILKET